MVHSVVFNIHGV